MRLACLKGRKGGRGVVICRFFFHFWDGEGEDGANDYEHDATRWEETLEQGTGDVSSGRGRSTNALRSRGELGA